jgi:hypothetical protein
MSQQFDRLIVATGEVSSTKALLVAQHRKLIDRRRQLLLELREIDERLPPLEAALKVLGVEKGSAEENDAPTSSELGITEAAARLLRAYPEGTKSPQLADRFARDTRWRLPEYSTGVSRAVRRRDMRSRSNGNGGDAVYHASCSRSES